MRVKCDIIKHYFLEVVIYLFALLFVYAAVSKLLDFETFETQLGQSPLLNAYAKPVAIGVPFLELLISFFLVFKRTRQIALYGFFAMMVMFTAYIIIILNFTDFVPCSCGGVLEAMGWTEHLVFNGVFVLFSVLSVWLISSKKRKILLTLCLLTIFSVGVVTILFLSSEKKIKRNNAFIRKYIPHPVEKLGNYDLGYNSYYIAGMDERNIYIGNVTAPFLIKSISYNLKDSQEHQLEIDSMEVLFKRVKIEVHPPYVYIGDGVVPIIFRGLIKDWNTSIYSFNEAYFTSFVIADSLNIGFTSISSQTKSNALGILHKSSKSDSVILNTDIIRTKTNKRFDSDGILRWNEKHRKFIYTYYYKNQFQVINEELSKTYTGKTIDTLTSPKTDIQYYQSKDVYKRGKSVFVNLQSSTFDDYLYIHSDRLGKYENEEALESASILDIYNITDNSYAFSFYLYHQYGKKLLEFKVHNNLLVALVDDKLWLYSLKPEYFNSGFR